MNRGVLGATRPQITALTGIRAIAAGWVVMEHFKEPLDALVPGGRSLDHLVYGGYLAVEIFFVLSGFIISYTYAERFRTFSGGRYRDFLLARFARIYPVHIVTLLVIGLLVVGAAIIGRGLNNTDIFTPTNFVANIFMLQAVPPFQAFDTPAWSLCVEFAAYFAFPLVGRWITRIRLPRSAFLWAAAIAVVGTAAILVAPLYLPDSPTFQIVNWIRIATDFTTGALLYAGWSMLGRGRTHRAWDWVALGSFGVVVVVLFIVPPTSTLGYLAFPAVALLVLATAGSAGWLHRFLSTRVMQWGGRLTFSVYMTHFILLLVGQKIFPWQRLEGRSPVLGVILLLTYYVLAVAVGAACHYAIEEPGRHLVRRIVARREGKRAAVPPEEVAVERRHPTHSDEFVPPAEVPGGPEAATPST